VTKLFAFFAKSQKMFCVACYDYLPIIVLVIEFLVIAQSRSGPELAQLTISRRTDGAFELVALDALQSTSIVLTEQVWGAQEAVGFPTVIADRVMILPHFYIHPRNFRETAAAAAALPLHCRSFSAASSSRCAARALSLRS
jgi:hypothetical protein